VEIMKQKDDEFIDVEKRFRDENGDCLRIQSQYGQVYSSLIKKIKKYAKTENLDALQFEDNLNEAKQVFDDMAYSLKCFWKNPSHDKFWEYPNISSDLDSPERWSGVSPVDPVLLDTATAEYLKRPWMQLNNIDLFILRGFIFNEVAHYADGIKSGAMEGRIDFAYLLSGGKLDKTLIYKLLFAGVKFTIQWILLPVLAAIFYYFGYETITLWILIAYLVTAGIAILFIPKRYFQNREMRDTQNKLNINLGKLLNVHRMCSYNTFNPSQLRSQIADLEQHDLHLPPPVYSILDRAIQRDPYVLLDE